MTRLKSASLNTNRCCKAIWLVLVVVPLLVGAFEQQQISANTLYPRSLKLRVIVLTDTLPLAYKYDGTTTTDEEYMDESENGHMDEGEHHGASGHNSQHHNGHHFRHRTLAGQEADPLLSYTGTGKAQMNEQQHDAAAMDHAEMMTVEQYNGQPATTQANTQHNNNNHQGEGGTTEELQQHEEPVNHMGNNDDMHGQHDSSSMNAQHGNHQEDQNSDHHDIENHDMAAQQNEQHSSMNLQHGSHQDAEHDMDHQHEDTSASSNNLDMNGQHDKSDHTQEDDYEGEGTTAELQHVEEPQNHPSDHASSAATTSEQHDNHQDDHDGNHQHQEEPTSNHASDPSGQTNHDINAQQSGQQQHDSHNGQQQQQQQQGELHSIYQEEQDMQQDGHYHNNHPQEEPHSLSADSTSSGHDIDMNAQHDSHAQHDTLHEVQGEDEGNHDPSPQEGSHASQGDHHAQEDHHAAAHQGDDHYGLSSSDHNDTPSALLTPFPQYQGFQPDLLRRLIQIAKDLDNITLSFELEEASAAYSHDHYFDRVANDCFGVEEDDCYRHDLIVGDFYGTPDRSMRTILTPPLLNTAAASLKYIHSHTQQVSTMATAQAMHATVCVQEGTHWASQAEKHFPHLHNTMICQNKKDCINMLKHHHCALWLGDELQLRYLTVHDPDLQVTTEHFHKQLIVWPLNARLNLLHQQLIIRWIYQAHVSGMMDELYHEYFEIAYCPKGKAGINCDQACSAAHGVSDRYGNCVCDSTRWTGDDCSVEVLEDKNLIGDSALLIMCYVMIGINFFAVAVCAIWLFCNRKEAPVKVAQPLFLGLVLLGCLISTSTIFALAQEDTGGSMELTMHIGTHANHGAMDHGHGEADLPACMAIPWLYSVGFSITFGSLFAKIRRVYLLFRAAATMQRVTVTASETFLIVGGVLLIDVIILTVWTTVDPLKWYREAITVDKYGHPLTSEGYCTSEHLPIFAGIIAAFHFTIMALACYLCYVSRDIPTRFSEGKYVTIAMISNLQIFVVAVPVLIIMGTNSQTSFFVRSVVIWMNDFAIVALIFGNLMYSVYYGGNLQRESSKMMVRNAMKSYTRRTKERESSEHGESILASAMHSLASKWRGGSSQVQRPSMASDSSQSYYEETEFASSGTLSNQASSHHRCAKAPPLEPVSEDRQNETEQPSGSSHSFCFDEPNEPAPEVQLATHNGAEDRCNVPVDSQATESYEDEFQSEYTPHDRQPRRPAIPPKPSTKAMTSPTAPQPRSQEEETRQSPSARTKPKRVSWKPDGLGGVDEEIYV